MIMYTRSRQYCYQLVSLFCFFQNVLKLRDQKQVDFEDLSDHLQQATTEREVLVNTGKGGTGIGSFLRETVDNIKGIDAERAKQERLVKLESRIDEVYIRRAGA